MCDTTSVTAIHLLYHCRVSEEFVWKLLVSSRGTLVRPDGVAIDLPYRKVGDLLVLLFEARANGLSRDVVCRSLWPSTPQVERMISLRQALSKARQLLGGDVIWANRAYCGMATTIRLEIDPEWDCPLLQEVGIDHRDLSWLGEQLELLACTNPVASIDAARSAPSLRPPITPVQLSRIAARWRSLGELSEAQEAWTLYYEGCSLFTSDIPRGLPCIRRSATLASRTGEWSLFAHAAFWSGALMLLIGEIDRTEELARKALASFGRRLGSGSYLMHNLLAHVDLHRGDVRSAIDRLARLEFEPFAGEHDQRMTRALRCLYLALDGRIAEAEGILDTVDEHPSHADVAPYYELARCAIETLDFRPQSFAVAEELAERLTASQSNHLALYTRELISVRAAEAGKAAYRDFQAPRIAALRMSLQMRRTAWDLARTRPRFA